MSKAVQTVNICEEDVALFQHQVAGHGSAEKGLLKHKKTGWVLKPLQPEPKRSREINFYERIASAASQSAEPYHTLSQFIPKYYGTVQLRAPSSQSGITQEYIVLQDVLEGLSKPCVIDLKIGAITWSPDASEKKIQQELSKYLGTKTKLGICLTGIQYWNDDRELKKEKRDDLKKLDPGGLTGLMFQYFCGNGTRRSDQSLTMIEKAISELQVIESVFKRQDDFKLFGSSLLMAYDWELVDESDCIVPLRVFMIDFAHYHESGEKGVGKTVDENYLFGIGNVVKILEQVRQKIIGGVEKDGEMKVS